MQTEDAIPLRMGPRDVATPRVVSVIGAIGLMDVLCRNSGA